MKVGCGEVEHLLLKAPVFREDSVFWKVVNSEWVFVVMVSVIDEGLFCSRCCWVIINHSKRLWGVVLMEFMSVAPLFSMRVKAVLLVSFFVDVLKFIQRDGKIGCKLSVEFGVVSHIEVVFIRWWQVFKLCLKYFSNVWQGFYE